MAQHKTTKTVPVASARHGGQRKSTPAAVTYSEHLFSEFCKRHGLVAEPVKRQRGRTPDYEVDLAGNRVIFEIKQLNPNKQDRAAIERLRRGKAFADYQRNRVRPILKDVSQQLKCASRSRKPAVVVVYNNTPFSAGTDPDSVLQAMFGRKKVVVSFDEDGAPTARAPVLSGNEGCTPDHNTALSALAVLRRDGAGALMLDVFHNPFAKIRLARDSLSGLPVRQLEISEGGTVCGYGSWPELRHYGIIER